MSSLNNNHEQPIPKLRRANDAIDTNTLKPPGLLFDEFWRSGEVALLFGAAGAGKSLLAVQLADALARGRGIAGFQMPGTRQNVLYVDLVLSDEQFAMRYSRETARGRRRAYKFPAGLFRDRPPDGAPLIEWLRAAVVNKKIRTVIVDDLSMISQSDDGTRETLAVVRELRRMTRELGISVLVLADSHPYVFERDIAERDLRRRRVLCAFADSVFAIEATRGTDERSLVQTRAQAGEIVWTHRSPSSLILETRDDGFVGFVLDQPELTREERSQIIGIKKMHDDDGQSFRSIAHAFDISKSTAARLYAKWKLELEEEVEEPDDEVDEEEEADEFPESYPGEHTDQYLMSIGMRPVWKEKGTRTLPSATAAPPPEGTRTLLSATAAAPPETVDPHSTPSADCVGIADKSVRVPKPSADCVGIADKSVRVPTAICDLEMSRDSHGREIYIESREEHTGKPRVWYKRGRGKRFTRFERSSHTIHVQPLGTSGWVP